MGHRRDHPGPELERKYGYETKHASHLVRLMLQVERVLAAGDYNPQLQEEALATVRDVLHGRWGYEQLVIWAEEADLRVRSMDSVLPPRPDRKGAEALLTALNRQSLAGA